jgi:hypothetical protein
VQLADRVTVMPTVGVVVGLAEMTHSGGALTSANFQSRTTFNIMPSPLALCGTRLYVFLPGAVAVSVHVAVPGTGVQFVQVNEVGESVQAAVNVAVVPIRGVPLEAMMVHTGTAAAARVGATNVGNTQPDSASAAARLRRVNAWSIEGPRSA